MADTNGNAKPTLPSLPSGEEVIAMYARHGSTPFIKGRIHVLILNDNGVWFAHGIEADYSVEGSGLEDVKKRFEVGMVATIREYLKRDGNIFAFFREAPDEYIRLYNEQTQQWYYTFRKKLDVTAGNENEVQVVKKAPKIVEPLAQLDVEYMTSGAPA